MAFFRCRFLQVVFLSFVILFNGSLSAQQENPFEQETVTVTTAAPQDIDKLNQKAIAEVSDEEKELLNLGMLPPYYPVLKLCLDGKAPYTGKAGGLNAAKALCKSFFPSGEEHYSRDFGNPVRMLDWAKKFKTDEKMRKLVTSARRGDVFLTGPRNQKDIDKNFICLMTKGPYYHATLVVDSPLPIIIEAVGITGNRFDTTSNKVRMSTWYEELGTWGAYRLVRPTFGLPAAQANGVIEKAVKYAEDQLGKPYDYSFSDGDGNNAFYCSELVNKAYTIGAGFKGKLAQKNPERDRIIIALNSAIDGLEPKNKYELSDKIMQFAVEYSHSPDINKLQEFIINELVPNCKVLEKAFPDSQARTKLNTVFNKIKSNEAFVSFSAAQKAYEAGKNAGNFKTGWGIGKLRELKSKAAIGIGLLKDIDRLGRESGASRKNLFMAFSKLFLPVYKNLGTFGELLSGMDKNRVVTLPAGVQTVIKMVDWATEKREEVKKWPIVGEMLANLMPGNGDGKIKTDFVSPSDLAQASPGFTINYP
ncbi:MAG: YiiX/YebB-like N1pC/P60 family cysteine hydrolase [Candidatus Riflebacteria bacterium]